MRLFFVRKGPDRRPSSILFALRCRQHCWNCPRQLDAADQEIGTGCRLSLPGTICAQSKGGYPRKGSNPWGPRLAPPRGPPALASLLASIARWS